MPRPNERLHYFNPRQDIEVHHHLVPHWEQEAVTYFVTFRLGDALPQSRLDQWKREREAWLAFHPPPWKPETEREYHQRFSTTLEKWLDQNHGSCLLQNPACLSLVADALHYFEDVRYIQHAFVIMPNHVHVLFTPIGGHALDSLIHSWKSYSAKEINKISERTGELWQRTYFDRIVRDEDHFRNCARYIRNNPQKAGLSSQRYHHYESAWVKSLGI